MARLSQAQLVSCMVGTDVLVHRRLVSASKRSIDLQAHLSPKQWEAWKSRARIISLLCGRRAGKTYWAVLWLLMGALECPGSLSVYLALTKTSARNIVWATMVQIGTEVLGLEARHFRDHTMEVKLPNGSRIIVSGTDDRKQIESWRGTKLYRAAIDEMGSQMPDLIEYFVQDIIFPCLADLDGRLALLGTPGLTCDGYWFDITKPEVLERDPGGFDWTIYDNPAIPHADAFIEEMLANPKISINSREDSAFRREWTREWVIDKGNLVYPYDPVRNGIDALPTVTETGIVIPTSAWRHVIGNDVGVVDECAWVVWAWCPAWPGSIAVDCHIDQYDPDPAGAKGQSFYQDYKRRGQTDYMLDTGGMGKTHEVIYRKKYAIPVLGAEKSGKPSAIRELRADLLSGRAKVLNGPHMNPLRSQWAVLGWDDRKQQHNPNQPDHIADAGLYGHRRVRHYTHNPNKDKPPLPLGTPERKVQEWEQRMERQARKRRRGRHMGVLDR